MVMQEIEPRRAPAQCCVPLATEEMTVDDAAATASLFKALGDPHRVRIVNLLHLPAGEVDEAGTECLMDSVERGVTRRLIVHREAPDSASSSIGGQLHTKLRSPNAPSIRATGGQILLRRTAGDG
jgi:DNA-binding transcriptional ArsR family regulator